jgi:hypothetical protein
MKTIRIIIIIGVLGAIVFLILQSLAWTGKLVAQTDFLKFTPYFSILKPQSAVQLEKNDNYIKIAPVYFDLYLPRDFDKAQVELEFKNEFGYQILVGPNIKEGWDLKVLEDLPSSSNDYKIKSIGFDLAGKNINNGKLRFMIFVPDLKDQSKGIYLKNVKVTLTRQPLWQGNIVQNLINYLTYVKTQN